MKNSNNFDSKGRHAAPAGFVKLAPLWLLALITFTGTVAMHMFVPALPAAAKDFHVSPGTVQLTLSAYISGLAIGQLFYGPLSDRFGRKTVLLCGVALFSLGSIGAGLADSIEMLIGARLLQALGGCSGLVLGKAIILDSARGPKATQRLALLSLIAMMGPGLAPLLGVVLVNLAGWRAIFVLLSMFGVSSILLIWRCLPETGPTYSQRLQDVLYNYKLLFKSKTFWGFSLGGSLATTSLYAYIASAPFLFIRELETSDSEMAFFLSLNIFGAWLGNICVSRLTFRVAARRLLQYGIGISSMAILTLGIICLASIVSKFELVALMMIFTFGAGVVSPVAMSEALNVNPRVAGSASGIYGFLQMCVGALSSYTVTLADRPLMVMIVVLLTSLFCARVFFRMAYSTNRTS